MRNVPQSVVRMSHRVATGLVILQIACGGHKFDMALKVCALRPSTE